MRHDLVTGSHLFIERVRKTIIPKSRLTIGPRVGVSYAGQWADSPLRFYVTDNPNVSRP